MSGLRTRLKKTIEGIAYWTVPPAFQDIAGSQWDTLKNRRNRDPEMEALFQRNIKFKDIHKGQRCFILATGPSINKQDLRPLKDEICIAVSGFFLHKDSREINPHYHVDSCYHPPYDFETIAGTFKGFQNYYSEKTTYFFGHNSYEYSVYNFLKQNTILCSDHIHFLNYFQTIIIDELNYNNPEIWDICKPLIHHRTVIYSAIQIAAYMGFKYIYLLGCDHDYLVNVSLQHTIHFYAKEEGIDDSKEEWPSTEDSFLGYYNRWKDYRFIRSYLERLGCYIYNATEGGLLDVFPKITLREALIGHT